MCNRRLVLLIGTICLLSCWMFLQPAPHNTVAYAQQPTPPAPDDSATIHVESRLVLVDSVVTDKKGTYIRDLTQKDFRVWEDGKEQPITSFSFEESNGSADSKPRYMVLFFDNSTMNFGDQAQARIAAKKFIDANAGPNRLIAIAEFGGTVRITQNFTSDANRLQQVVSNTQGSAVSPNAPPVMTASLGAPPSAPFLGNAEADFGVHTVLLALRDLAKGLSTVPGRKTLVMLTSGFQMNSEYQSELTAVIDTCNKSNVAIYPIDVRGLVAPQMSGPHSHLGHPSIHSASPTLTQAAFHYSGMPALLLAAFAEPAPMYGQHGTGGGGGGSGGGSGGGGGHGGGGGTGSGGGTGGGGGTGSGGGKGGGSGTGGGTGAGKGGGGTTGSAPGNGYNSLYNPYAQPRQIVPPFPTSATDNQQVLYQLADGTGGFVILNTNDLLGGLQRISQDQNQYYLLGYKPPVSSGGSCHSLKVKVERGGTEVRARSGYCNARPVDLLAGNPVEKDLESRAGGEMKGNVAASMQAPFFFTSPNTAQIHLAVEIPSSAMQFQKVNGKQHAALNILGIAYKPDNSIAARFSDTVNLDFDGKKEVEEFRKQSFHYENQFGIASGEYKLKVVFSSGNESFGKLESPLVIDSYRDQDFSMSAIALSNSIRDTGKLSTDLDSQLLEDKTPLLVKGLQISPSASNHFKKTDTAAIYAEVYEPLLREPKPPQVAYEVTIVDRKSGQQKVHLRDRLATVNTGNPVIPLGLKLPVENLDVGSYHLELRALDTAGNISKMRSTDFEVE